MSAKLTSTPLAGNRTDLNDDFISSSSSPPPPQLTPNISHIPTSETNPANMEKVSKIDQSSSNSSCNKLGGDSALSPDKSSSQESKPTTTTPSDAGGDEVKVKTENDCDNHHQDSTNEHTGDSSIFSTAFTISFEDDSNANKKLGIKDPLRKFAPPKPHTIEKPRQTKSDQCQDHSLISIESAPAGLGSKHSSGHRKSGYSNSSRSSSRRSNSSRHSNISESAAFLIDKMLNCKQPADRDACPSSSSDRHGHGSGSSKHNNKSPAAQSTKGIQPKRMTHPGDGILDSEIDFCEDKSDNGTYIVGADPESEAARKKIDELFGVVKAAEASVIADSRNQASSRQSRIPDKKVLSRARQEHIDRLARKNSPMSRSSSSSRHDNVASADQRPMSSSRHSRNSSCDRVSRGHGSRPSRRSVSQSSRQSSNKEISDGDTRSSRSSLHNADLEGGSQENQLSSHPSMKFNRAFALRRARLGLGEPVRVSSTQNNYIQEPESVNNLSSSQRRHHINTNTYHKANQNNNCSGSANFSRDDGGRFSLRMKGAALPPRMNSAHGSNRSPQHSTLLDSYMSKVSSSKLMAGTPVMSALAQQQQQQQQEGQSRGGQQHRATPTNLSYTPTSLPYQSSDDHETMSPSRYRLLMKTGRLQRKGVGAASELESDTDSYNNRFNFSLGTDYDSNNHNQIESRACSSTGKRGSALQLGALDSLVISAISSLSLKIRQSVCDVLVEHAKKLPVENETRLIVEEILPQLTANSSSSKSPTSIEEIDQSLYFDLAKTLKNLKKVEQMVEVITLISNQLPSHSNSNSSSNSTNFKPTGQTTMGNMRTSDSTTNSEINSINDLSPV